MRNRSNPGKPETTTILPSPGLAGGQHVLLPRKVAAPIDLISSSSIWNIAISISMESGIEISRLSKSKSIVAN